MLSVSIWLVATHAIAAEFSRKELEGNEPEVPRAGTDFVLAHPVLPVIWVAPGEFLLSATHGAGDDTRVRLTRGYWLGRTEVTQAQWQAVMHDVPLPSFFKGSELPVERVSWLTAMVFCSRLTEQERVAGRLPPGYIYTLPTEAQWEYACRAGTRGLFAGDVAAMAWYDENSGERSRPVGQKQANAWGFHDMHGNVMEWCWDWYAGYPGGTADDPTGPEIGQFRVVRGGSWAGALGGCRSAFRWFSPTNTGVPSTGFRVALAPVPIAKPPPVP